MGIESANVLQRDLWTMLLSTIRYSMGRMTYMSSEAPALYHRYKSKLTTDQKSQLYREVSEELEGVTRVGKLLGMQCDHDEWVRLRDQLAEELSRLGG